MDASTSSTTLKAQHLLKLSQSVAKKSPVLSRFYRQKARNLKIKPKTLGYSPLGPAEVRYPGDGHCPRCSALWNEDNHSIRLRPKMHLSKHMQRLIRQTDANVRSLKTYQKRLVDMYNNSSNTMMISCRVCGETFKVSGQKRFERVQQQVSLQPVLPEVPKKTKKERKKEKQKQKRRRQREERLGLSLSGDAVLSGLSMSAFVASSLSTSSSSKTQQAGASQFTASETSISFSSLQEDSPASAAVQTSTPISAVHRQTKEPFATPSPVKRLKPGESSSKRSTTSRDTSPRRNSFQNRSTPKAPTSLQPAQGFRQVGVGQSALSTSSLTARTPRQPPPSLSRTLGASPLSKPSRGAGKQKQRQKALHQQLQLALKSGQPKQGAGSLSDFLTSLKQSGLK